MVGIATLLWALCATIENLAKARTARDLGDTQALHLAIQEAQRKIAAKLELNGYIDLALLNDWMCEAAVDREDRKLARTAAEAGIRAAEKAVAIDPQSSDAHWLLGDLLSQLIPYVTAGGIRHGPRATRELEVALKLNPMNEGASVSRAVVYFLTPAAFGGSKSKSVELLQGVVTRNSSQDLVGLAHSWLSQLYFSDGKYDMAKKEAEEAKLLNPQRIFIKRTITHK